MDSPYNHELLCFSRLFRRSSAIRCCRRDLYSDSHSSLIRHVSQLTKMQKLLLLCLLSTSINHVANTRSINATQQQSICRKYKDRFFLCVHMHTKTAALIFDHPITIHIRSIRRTRPTIELPSRIDHHFSIPATYLCRLSSSIVWPDASGSDLRA